MFLESVILMCLIPTALLIEFTEEYVDEFLSPEHRVHKPTYKGDAKMPMAGDGMHMHTSTLYKALAVRIKGELMVLGYLAFIVWSVTQVNIWEEFVPPKHSYDNFPQDWHTLHTVVDAVHMHLFIAMVLHFGVIFAVIWNASFVIHIFTNTQVFLSAWHAEHRGEAWEGFPSMKDIKPRGDTIPERRMPLSYTGMPQAWYSDFYSKLTYHIGTCWGASEKASDTVNLFRSFMVHHCKQHAVIEKKEDQFYPVDLSVYTQLCINNMVHEIIHFSPWSWILCFLTYAFIAIMTKVLPHGDAVEYIILGINCLVAVLFFVLKAYIMIGQNFILNDFEKRHHQGDTPLSPRKVSVHSSDFKADESDVQRKAMKARIENYYIIVAQALAFLTCFSLARIVGAKRFYENSKSEEWLIYCYFFLYVVNGFFFMPRSLPWAAVIFCMPPYMDTDDERRLDEVLKARPWGLERKHAQDILRRWPQHIQEAAGIAEFVRLSKEELAQKETTEEPNVESVLPMEPADLEGDCGDVKLLPSTSSAGAVGP